MLKLERARAQLLLIDLQERLMPAIDGGAAVLARAVTLVTAARRLGVPVTVSEQYPKGLGATLAPLLAALEGSATRLEKTSFSCLGDPGLAEHLGAGRAGGRDQVVVAGAEAHVCVAQSVLDLLAAGCEVMVVADAVGSRRPESRTLALGRLAQAGAVVGNTEMVVFEWLERAGTAEFKALMPLIR